MRLDKRSCHALVDRLKQDLRRVIIVRDCLGHIYDFDAALTQALFCEHEVYLISAQAVRFPEYQYRRAQDFSLIQHQVVASSIVACSGDSVVLVLFDDVVPMCLRIVMCSLSLLVNRCVALSV